MIEFILGILIGLALGWIFIPQPSIIKSLFVQIIAFVKYKLNWK